MPGPDRLPGPEHLREIPPGDPTPIPLDDPLDDLSGIPKRPAPLARPNGQQARDQLPLGIGQQLKTRHPSSPRHPTRNFCQTRPSRCGRYSSAGTGWRYLLVGRKRPGSVTLPAVKTGRPIQKVSDRIALRTPLTSATERRTKFACRARLRYRGCCHAQRAEQETREQEEGQPPALWSNPRCNQSHPKPQHKDHDDRQAEKITTLFHTSQEINAAAHPSRPDAFK